MNIPSLDKGNNKKYRIINVFENKITNPEIMIKIPCLYSIDDAIKQNIKDVSNNIFL